MVALHTAPPELCTSKEVERLGEYMARKLGWVDRFPQWRKKPTIAFLHRHIEKLGKGEPLQLIMRFYGRGAEDVVWHVEWKDGWLGTVGEEDGFDDGMAERYKGVRRHFN
jgi:hypothetical protein